MRYLPHSEHERADMLAVIGAKTAEDLFARVPSHALLREPVNLPRAFARVPRRSAHEGAGRARTMRPATARSSSAPALTGTMCRRRSIT